MSRLFGTFLTIGVLGGVSCSPVEQPASFKQVAAIEVPIRTLSDRSDLLLMLKSDASAIGAEMVDHSAEWQRFERQTEGGRPDPASVLHKTFYAGLFGDHSDNDRLADLDDGGHEGRPWLIFFKGRRPEKAANLRAHLLADIKHRWPDARDIPIMPNGSLPLDNDLTWTGHAYVVRRDRVAAYRPSAAPSR